MDKLSTEMMVTIEEHIGKSTQRINIAFSEGSQFKFEGNNCLQELEETLKKFDKQIKKTKRLDYYINNEGLKYLPFFISLERLIIRGSKSPLVFPDSKKLKKLATIFVNSLTQPTRLEGIAQFKNLKQLFIGDFTFGKAVHITDFDEIVMLENLEELVLSNVKVAFSDLLKLKNIKTLKKLTLNQKFEFAEFAELSVRLPNVTSNELKPWQLDPREEGKVKINGKRKPYLSLEKDMEQIKKFEVEFEALQKKFRDS